jgi:hypothetical protein
VNDEKYIGLDVHQATIVVAVMDSTGKLVMESILETEAATILQFFAGLRGTLSVTFEEGTWSVWLYDLLNPHVDKLRVVSFTFRIMLHSSEDSVARLIPCASPGSPCKLPRITTIFGVFPADISAGLPTLRPHAC